MARILFDSDFHTAYQQRSASVASLQRQLCVALLEALQLADRDSMMIRMDNGLRFQLTVPDRVLRNQLNQLLCGYKGLKFVYEPREVLFTVVGN